MDNYEYCVRWAMSQGGKVLDFGCGAGKAVQMMRARGIEAYGCDTFFDGGDFSSAVPRELAGTVIQRMQTNIPFPDGQFDLVMNNMVMEHVPDIDHALSEIARVLKPGGHVLSLFPYQGIWYEGHSRVPFLHWFGKGRARVYYMALMSFLGFGVRKGRKRMEWCRWTCEYMDQWIHYRTLPQIHAAYSRYFVGIEHQEAHWLVARTRYAALFPAMVRAFIARKFATLVFTCSKPQAG